MPSCWFTQPYALYTFMSATLVYMYTPMHTHSHTHTHTHTHTHIHTHRLHDTYTEPSLQKWLHQYSACIYCKGWHNSITLVPTGQVLPLLIYFILHTSAIQLQCTWHTGCIGTDTQAFFFFFFGVNTHLNFIKCHTSFQIVMNAFCTEYSL